MRGEKHSSLESESSGDAQTPARRGVLSRGAAPLLAAAAVVAAAAFALRLEGRAWLCACGRFTPWLGDAWNAETSQQLFDPYSLTHVLHGFALAGLLSLAAPRVGRGWRFFLAVTLEALWEVFENTEFVVNRYRETTAALGYTGDTVVNSLGDIAACALGFLVARSVGALRTLLLFVAVEAALLFWIRDSLLLNVLLLVYPSESLRAWQAGH